MSAIPRAVAVAWTAFDPTLAGDLTGWATDAVDPTNSGGGGQALAEFAGRACYQSWGKPNPATASNAGYLRHILEVGHLSVLEHATVTLYLTGVSRSLTHELVRHRHLSYSQLSQRYVDGADFNIVIPPALQDDPEIVEGLHGVRDYLGNVYATLVKHLTERGLGRKQSRQAARCVLPNMTETRIVVTGNYRAWRHFITMRATEAADVEIRAAAVAILRELQWLAPAVFADYVITVLADGSAIATSDLGRP